MCINLKIRIIKIMRMNLLINIRNVMKSILFKNNIFNFEFLILKLL